MRNVCGNYANVLKANEFGKRSRLNKFLSLLSRSADSGKSEIFKNK